MSNTDLKYGSDVQYALYTRKQKLSGSNYILMSFLCYTVLLILQW